MYANSYDGWFLGSRTGRLGGWSSSKMIVQMRKAYTDKPLTMWNKITDPELRAEWQAEVIFSENPVFALAFSPVYSNNLDSRSNQSCGSRKEIENLGGWMEANASKIDGYRIEKAALLQLDLLTKSQIKEAFLEMDPLAIKKITE